jgi:hypothetical protein
LTSAKPLGQIQPVVAVPMIWQDLPRTQTCTVEGVAKDLNHFGKIQYLFSLPLLARIAVFMGVGCDFRNKRKE